MLKAFAKLEQARLIHELNNLDTSHIRRRAIGERLCAIGDARPGVGLRSGRLPDIEWCYVDVPEQWRGWKLCEGRYAEFEINPFYIAKYPITFVQFQAFLDDPDGWNRDEWWQGLGQKQQDRYEQCFKFANYPRENVSWYQAVAFCRWLNTKLPIEARPNEIVVSSVSSREQEEIKHLFDQAQDTIKLEIRLPTDWEWKYAATGDQSANTYPWGPDWDDRRTNTIESGLSQPTAVGMYPHGVAPVGALDMSGNVWEWCLNTYFGRTYVETTSPGQQRVVHGGAWDTPRSFADCEYITDFFSSLKGNNVGFRVVAALPLRSHAVRESTPPSLSIDEPILQTRDWSARVMAAVGLAYQGDLSVFETLLQAVHDSNPTLQIDAARGLAHLADPSATPVLQAVAAGQRVSRHVAAEINELLAHSKLDTSIPQPAGWIRQQVHPVLCGLIDGTVDVVTGCRRLAQLYRYGYTWIPIIFVGLDSELDSVPPPNTYHQWNPQALERKLKEAQPIVATYRAQARAEAQKLLDEYFSDEPCL